MRTVAEMVAQGVSLEDAVQELRREYVLAVLASCKYDQCKAAATLGMHRNTLSRQLEAWGISARALKQAEKRHSLTEAEKLEVRAYVRAHAGCRKARKAMAEKYGIAYGYIVRVCRGVNATADGVLPGAPERFAIKLQEREAFVDSVMAVVPAVPSMPVRKVQIAGRWVPDPRAGRPSLGAVVNVGVGHLYDARQGEVSTAVRALGRVVAGVDALGWADGSAAERTRIASDNFGNEGATLGGGELGHVPQSTPDVSMERRVA